MRWHPFPTFERCDVDDFFSVLRIDNETLPDLMAMYEAHLRMFVMRWRGEIIARFAIGSYPNFRLLDSFNEAQQEEIKDRLDLRSCFEVAGLWIAPELRGSARALAIWALVFGTAMLRGGAPHFLYGTVEPGLRRDYEASGIKPSYVAHIDYLDGRHVESALYVMPRRSMPYCLVRGILGRLRRQKSRPKAVPRST